MTPSPPVAATVSVSPARDEAERRAAFALRREVFVGEQGVRPEAEFDAHDRTATHLVARLGADEVVVGALRWRVAAPGVGKIERVVVRRDLRGSRIGVALMDAVLAELTVAGLAEAVLNAQLAVQTFYERFGFAAEGPVFEEEGIAHVRMRRRLDDPGAVPR